MGQLMQLASQAKVAVIRIQHSCLKEVKLAKIFLSV